MSRKEKPKPELSFHARILAGWLMSGHFLRAQIDNTEEGAANGGMLYWIDPTGKKCGPKSARELIAKGKVEPLEDGLFPGFDQSFRWKG